MSEFYELPDGWEWKKLSNITKLQNGFAFKSKLFTDNGLPIIRIKNIQNEKILLDDVVYFNLSDYVKKLDSYQIKKNDILIAMSGATTGKIGLYESDEISYLNQRVGLFRIDNSDLRSYLFYFLSTQMEKNLEQSLGAAQPNLSTQQINDMNIPLPPLQEQKRIVTKLDTLFEKIDKAIALHQKNMDEADAFMGSVLNEVFGELEEKYPKSKLNEIVTFGGTNISTLDYPNLIYFSLEDIEAHSGKILKYQTVREAGVKGTAVRFDPQCVLYSKLRPYLNKVAISEQEGCSTTELVVLRPKNMIDKYFLASYLRSPKIVGFLHNDSMGAKMPRTNMKTFRELAFSIPPLQAQQKVVKYLDDISEKTEKVKAVQKEKMESLKALKASILDQAFRGGL